VGKDGPNKGRPFFACSRGGVSAGGCDFFAWGDVGGGGGGGGGYQTNFGGGGYASAGAGPQRQTPFCGCKPPEPSVVKTTQKEGPNKGRQFFSCCKGRDEGTCGFFEWCDGQGNAVPTGASMELSARRDRETYTCSHCKQVGHYAKECSNTCSNSASCNKCKARR